MQRKKRTVYVKIKKKNELTDRFSPAIDRSIQKQPQEMFYKTAVLKNFAIFV